MNDVQLHRTGASAAAPSGMELEMAGSLPEPEDSYFLCRHHNSPHSFTGTYTNDNMLCCNTPLNSKTAKAQKTHICVFIYCCQCPLQGYARPLQQMKPCLGELNLKVVNVHKYLKATAVHECNTTSASRNLCWSIATTGNSVHACKLSISYYVRLHS